MGDKADGGELTSRYNGPHRTYKEVRSYAVVMESCCIVLNQGLKIIVLHFREITHPEDNTERGMYEAESRGKEIL